MAVHPLVTLISDLGTSSPYPAWLKGSLYRNFEQVTVVDVSHDLRDFDIREAAYLLKSTYWQFPENSIHLIHLNALEQGGRILYVQYDKHHFLSFDNGIFHLAFEKTPEVFRVIHPNLAESDTMIANETLALAAAKISQGVPADEFSETTIKVVERRNLAPRGTPGSVKGHVVYIDKFQNLITNISRELYDYALGDQPIELLVAGFTLTKIHTRYSDVEEGEIACFFNSTGLLEIAVNKGKAASLLGMTIDKPIMILNSRSI